ncbi:MAG: ABATE domain-containing protein [Actinomycetota bacterium]|nr:ABATE domain-containing protein [Actinomycetota bacterium]
MGDATYRFDAGRVSLDLMATLANRCGERLPHPDALGVWLRAGGLVKEPCRVDAGDLARGRALRGALFGVIDAVMRDELPSAADVETINAAAAVAAHKPRLVLHTDGLRCERRASSIAEILGEIARDAIDLLTGPQRALLRECVAEDCSGIYVDASRGRTRRWCSTARCGNRARVAAHRARRRSVGEQPAP